MAPLDAPYLPAAQATHVLVPDVNELYVPATHAVHCADVLALNTLPYVPMVHAVHEEVPARELYLPAAHEVHAEVPVASALYLPAAHAVHCADVLALNTLPYVPMVHAVHEEVPVRELYLPAAHDVHPVVPVVSALNEPAAHATHALPRIYDPAPHDVQNDTLVAATSLNKPTPHDAHTVVPVVRSL